MTHSATTIDADSAQVRLGTAAQRMIAMGVVLAVAGLGLAAGLGLHSAEAYKLFWHGYLVAFAFYLSITLGALFFVLLHHLARAGWSVTLRRLAEGLSGNVVLMAVLLIPLLLQMGQLYEWSHSEAAAHDPILASKAVFLNPTAFVVRMVVYFAVWGGLAWFFRSRSIQQDATGDVRSSVVMERVSAPGMIALAVTLTFAAVDLLMSLNPHWHSTIFGVYFFANCVLAGLTVLTLLARWLQSLGRLGDAVNTEHYHDLGKLTFAFVFFWGYVAFSQYMLMWYANLPDETQFFIPRQIGPWGGVSLALLVCHLLIPFAGLLSRHAKRRVGVLVCWSIWLLGALLLDLFWVVMPSSFIQEIPHAIGAARGTALPQALPELVASNQAIYQLAENHAAFMQHVTAPLQPASVIMVLALVVGMGGLYLASTARLLRGAALVAVRDPRLPESLAFENG
jgi:hypothetical protein